MTAPLPKRPPPPPPWEPDHPYTLREAMDFVSCGELVMAKDILGLDIAEADVLFKAMEDPEILKKVRERQFRQALLLMEGPMRGPDGVLAKLAEARHDAEQLVAKGHHFPLEIQ